MKANFRVHKTDDDGRVLQTFGIGGNSWHTLDAARKIRDEWGGVIKEYNDALEPLWEIF